MTMDNNKELLKVAFSVIDPDGKGYITFKGLRKIVRDLNLDFTDEEMRDMIEEADPTGDGHVNFASVHTMFVETHLAISEETKKRWKEYKKRVALPKYRQRRTVEKVKVTKLPGKKLTPKEAKNIDRFNRLSLNASPEKVKVTKKPGISIRERRELELEKERASGDEDNEKVGNSKSDSKNKSVTVGNANSYAKKSVKKQTVKSDQSVIKSEMSQRSVRNNGEGYGGANYGGATYGGSGSRGTGYRGTGSGGASYEGTGYGEADYGDVGNGVDGYYGEEDSNQPPQQDTTSLPPIEKHNGVSPHHSPTASKKMSVHERLYDPDYRKNRSIPTEPEPIYVREFKSRPPKNLEHVKSKHMDPSYFEPRGEYIIETDEERASPQFKAKLPRGMEHIESRHMNPEYQKKRSSDEASGDEQMNPQFQARLPKGMEHVQSKILDPKYYQEKQPPEDNEYYDTEFRARPPKKLENVQSRIMDPRYFQERQVPEEERYDTEFRAKLPKKLEHVQSRLLDPPKKPKQSYEEPDSISLPSFRAKPPRHLEQVSSRILDPQYYEPKPEYSYENEDKYDHNFKARIPKRMQHVESRVLDSKYFKKKIPPIPTEEREAQNLNHDFKARLPKNLAHVQSRAFDPAYNKQLSPRSGSPVIELKQRGQVVVINVKKDPERRSKSQGHKEKVYTPRGQYNTHGRQDGIKTGLGLTVPEIEEKPAEKKQKKPWRPPRGPKPEKINREFFDSWVMSPTHAYRDNNDMFYNNRRNVSEMWTSLARTIKKSVIENGDRIRSVERTYY